MKLYDLSSSLESPIFYFALHHLHRYPRPRQRASPPGQAAYLSTAAAGRGFTGAQSESARSLHQGDGASAPYEQLPKQYQPPATGSGIY